MVKIRKEPDILRILINRKPYSVTLQRMAFEKTFAAMGVPRGTHVSRIDADGVPAAWISAKQTDEDHVIFYIHGGGFMMGSIQSHRPILARLSRESEARGFIIDYRRTPKYPYPAALIDCLTAYRWLLQQGADPAKTAIVGDSSGGGLALSSLMALRDAGDPLPAVGYLISPWVDLANSDKSVFFAMNLKRTIFDFNLRHMAEMYLDGRYPRDPLISPVYGDLAGLPPLLIQAGRDEPLNEDALRIADRAAKYGVEVWLDLYQGPIHVLQLYAPISREAERLISRAGGFIKKAIRK